LIESTDLIPKQAKDFDLNIVEPCDHVMNLPLHHHADAVHAFQKLEDPAPGWPLRRLVALMRYRGMGVGSWLPPSALRQRIHQQSQRHHRQEPVHPTGVFDEQRRDKKQGGFEQADPALDA